MFFVITNFMFFCFSEEYKVKVPNFQKLYSDGYFEYKICTDENGKINSVNCLNEQKGSISVNYIDNGDVDLSVKRNSNTKKYLLKKDSEKERFQIIDNRISVNSENGDWTSKYSNSILNIINNNTNEVEERIEYNTDGASAYLSSNGGFYLSKTLISYDFWEDEIQLSVSGIGTENFEVNKNNFLILSKYDYMLSQILIPYIFNQSFDYKINLYSANSELREGNTVYKAENLKQKTGLPWASNHQSEDIIELNLDVKHNLNLVIYNGFQNEEKKYLYKQNCRAKEIKIEFEEIKRNKNIILEDSPEGQKINLSDILLDHGNNANIKITILSVYEGTKYKDLCIQAILTE